MQLGAIMPASMDAYLLSAIREDITSEDITTCAVLQDETPGSVELICKQDGVLAGLPVFQRVFALLDPAVSMETAFCDGEAIAKGTVIGVLHGDLRVLLSGERTALNYLQRMSGIATLTRSCVRELAGSKTRLLDTRKTTPNMRLFEKYAVKVGGGCNHRYNLSDGILLKDNHIATAGGVAKAVACAKAYAPFVRKIEVEAETLAMVEEALAAGADIIMLDNMDDAMLREAVARIGNRALTECSGNVTKERLKVLAEIGVDFVSVGALTHSAPILDFSLKNMRAHA